MANEEKAALYVRIPRSKAEKLDRAAFDRDPKTIEVAGRQNARSWELRATVSLAGLLDKQGHRDKAWTMLNEIYTWFTEGLDTLDLQEARALIFGASLKNIKSKRSRTTQGSQPLPLGFSQNFRNYMIRI